MPPLAQQRLGTPESHRHRWLEAQKALVGFPALFKTAVGEFQERGPRCHPEVSTPQTRPDFRGRGITQMGRGFPAHSASFSFFS